MEFVVASVTVEAATTITIPEVLAMISVSDEPVVGLTPAQVELVPSLVQYWKGGSGVHQQDYLQLMISRKS